MPDIWIWWGEKKAVTKDLPSPKNQLGTLDVGRITWEGAASLLSIKHSFKQL